jgi:hypothetical protein
VAGLLPKRIIKTSGGEEGDIRMKKTIILCDHADGLYSRAIWLNSLFPECEIEVRMVSPSDDFLEFDAFDVPAKVFRTKEFAR